LNDKLNSFNHEKKSSEKLMVIAIIAIALGIIILLIGNQIPSEPLSVIGMIITSIGVITGIVSGAKFAKIKRRFKHEVLSHFFEEAIPGTKYFPEQGLMPVDVYQTEFLKRADRFHSEDLIRGQMDDVEFVSSDVRLEERHVQHTKNGTRVYYVPYFIGRVFIFTFNKEFDGRLQVLEAGSPLSDFKFLRVKLESIDFNKKFRTFATNELTAFYILTPDIMEALFEVEKRNPGRIGLSFQGDHLYIAINNNKDTFEIKMFQKIDDHMMDEFKRDLLVIQDFIHTLKLNTKIFKRKTQN